MPPRIHKATAILPSIKGPAVAKDVVFELPWLHPKQAEFVWAFENHPGVRFVVAACGTKAGKELKIDTPIPTPNGWKQMGDLQVGDLVFDENGCPTYVVSASEPRLSTTMYKVTFTDGEFLFANAEHLWTVRNYRHGDKGRRKEWFTLTTQEILDRGVASHPNKKGYRKYNWQIPTTGPLEYTPSDGDLLIEPYLLGTWLGDGSSSAAMITSADEDILKSWRDFGWIITHRSQYDYGITGAVRFNKKFSLLTKLGKLGVLNNKHIPECYLRASVEQRKALLAGLLDTDGYCSRKRGNGSGGSAVFYNTNKRLVDQVYELAVSLGCRVTVKPKRAVCKGKDCGLCYTVTIRAPFQPFRLPRKQERYTPSPKQCGHRSIVSIEKSEDAVARCIAVSNPSRLYLAGTGCIPTHNTHGACVRVVHEAWNGFNGKLIWWLAPSYAQSENSYNTIRRMLPKDTFKEEKAKLALQLINPSGGLHSRIEFKSGEKGDNLRGFGVHVLVADEFARIKREAIISAMTTQLQTKGIALYLSTPRGHDDFFNEFQKGDKSKLRVGQPDPHPDYISFRMPSWVNPTLPEGTIEDMRRNMPSDVFKQEVEAEFIDGATAVFRGAHDCIQGFGFLEPEKGKRYVMGVDLARVRDFSVITVVDAVTKHVVYWDRFQDNSWEMQLSRIISVSKKYNGAMVVIDATAIGDAPSQKLSEYVSTTPFKINSNQAKRELIEKLRLAIEQRQITYPPIQQLLDELNDFELEVTTSGTVVYGAPRGKHDDCVISLALANWQLSQVPFKYAFRRIRL